jgi:hypothetical protein
MAENIHPPEKIYGRCGTTSTEAELYELLREATAQNNAVTNIFKRWLTNHPTFTPDTVDKNHICNVDRDNPKPCTFIAPFGDTATPDLYICEMSGGIHMCGISDCSNLITTSDNTIVCELTGKELAMSMQLCDMNHSFQEDDPNLMATNLKKGDKSRIFYEKLLNACGQSEENRTRITRKPRKKSSGTLGVRRSTDTNIVGGGGGGIRRNTKNNSITTDGGGGGGGGSSSRSSSKKQVCTDRDRSDVSKIVHDLFWHSARLDLQLQIENGVKKRKRVEVASVFTTAKKKKTSVSTIRVYECIFRQELAACEKRSHIPPYCKQIHRWLVDFVVFAFERFMTYIKKLKRFIRFQDRVVAEKQRTSGGIKCMELIRITPRQRGTIATRLSLTQFTVYFMQDMCEGAVCPKDAHRITIDKLLWVKRHMMKLRETKEIFPLANIQQSPIKAVIDTARRLHDVRPFSNGPPSLSQHAVWKTPPPRPTPKTDLQRESLSRKTPVEQPTVLYAQIPDFVATEI